MRFEVEQLMLSIWSILGAFSLIEVVHLRGYRDPNGI